MLIMHYHFIEKIKTPLAIKKAIGTVIKLQKEINKEASLIVSGMQEKLGAILR